MKGGVGPTNLGVEGVPFNFDSMGGAYFFPPIIKKCKETLVWKCLGNFPSSLTAVGTAIFWTKWRVHCSPALSVHVTSHVDVTLTTAAVDNGGVLVLGELAVLVPALQVLYGPRPAIIAGLARCWRSCEGTQRTWLRDLSMPLINSQVR